MPRRSLIAFIVLNILVTFLVTSAIILISDRTRQGLDASRGAIQPLIVVVTATLNPNQKQSTQVVMVVTATPNGGTDNAASTSQATDLGSVPTLDPSLLPPNIGTLDVPSFTATAEGGCPTYTLKSGDIVGAIAQRFNISQSDLLKANNLTDTDAKRLQIGKTLIIPAAGCGLPTAEPSITPTKFLVPGASTAQSTVQATITSPATAANAQLEVTQVIDPGIYATEAIEIHNISGGTIELSGWTIKDIFGNTFTFPKYQLLADRRLVIYTRFDKDSPFALFWGQPKPIWSVPNQEITIADAKGTVKLKYALPGPQLVSSVTSVTDMPSNSGAATPAQ